MIQTATVFCFDSASRVLASRDVEFRTREELARELQADLDQYPMVEAWVASVRICLLSATRAEWSRVNGDGSD